MVTKRRPSMHRTPIITIKGEKEEKEELPICDDEYKWHKYIY